MVNLTLDKQQNSGHCEHSDGDVLDKVPAGMFILVHVLTSFLRIQRVSFTVPRSWAMGRVRRMVVPLPS